MTNSEFRRHAINTKSSTGSDPLPEVICAPREPIPSSGKEEDKGPTGFLRQTPTSVETPLVTKRLVAAPVPKADLPILAVAAIPVQRRSNDPQLQLSRPIFQPDHKKKDFSLPPNSQELVNQPTDAAFLSPNLQLVESFSPIQTDTPWSIANIQKRPVDTPIEVIFSNFAKNFRFHHIRYCCYEEQLKEMMKEIQILGPQAKPVDTLKEHLICFYRSSENIWYRIRIVNTAKKNGILCQSLDYGKFYCVPINNQKDFRIMKESLKQIPSFAICVELAGLNIEREIAKVDKDNLIGRKYLMDIVREGKHINLVKLKSFDGEDLAVKLSKNGCSSHESRR